MQARLSNRATTVGVNGDFFKLRTGVSSGLFLRDGVLSSPPNVRRSGLALAARRQHDRRRLPPRRVVEGAVTRPPTRSRR